MELTLDLDEKTIGNLLMRTPRYPRSQTIPKIYYLFIQQMFFSLMNLGKVTLFM